MDECDNLFLNIFDFNREGFRHIGERICLYLDYHSLVNLKGTCGQLYRFLQSTDLEVIVLERKLLKDWGCEPRKSNNIPFSPSTPVGHVKLLNDNTVLIASTRNIYNCNIGSCSSSIDKKENEDIEVRVGHWV